MGMGAVCHTLNPRLTAAQLAAMVAQSGARVLVVSADLAPLARQIAEAARSLEILLIIDGSVDPAMRTGWRSSRTRPRAADRCARTAK